jgi:hypothetical protein
MTTFGLNCFSQNCQDPWQGSLSRGWLNSLPRCPVLYSFQQTPVLYHFSTNPEAFRALNRASPGNLWRASQSSKNRFLNRQSVAATGPPTPSSWREMGCPPHVKPSKSRVPCAAPAGRPRAGACGKKLVSFSISQWRVTLLVAPHAITSSAVSAN